MSFNLLACDCDTFGSNGTSCNENGQCNCLQNFDGNKCNVCKPGSYMYPRCLGKPILINMCKFHIFINLFLRL